MNIANNIIGSMTACLCIANMPHTEKSPDEFEQFPPAEIKKSLPPLMYDAFVKIKNSSGDLDEAIDKHLSSLPLEIGRQLRTDAAVTVRSEEGRPIENAVVHLEEINDGAGGEIHEWNRRFQATKTTDANGKVIFHNIPYYNGFYLSKAIGFANKWPSGNLRINVNKEGYQPVFRDFVGINKMGIAFSLEWHSIIRKGRKLRHEIQGRKPDPPINPHFVFPDINMHEHIELELILKKDVAQPPQRKSD